MKAKNVGLMVLALAVSSVASVESNTVVTEQKIAEVAKLEEIQTMLNDLTTEEIRILQNRTVKCACV